MNISYPFTSNKIHHHNEISVLNGSLTPKDISEDVLITN